MTIKSLYPASRPALGLDFAKTKRLDPRVAFTRASTGTFVGADGLIKTAGNNVPRFDHNPTTGESLGLLVEEARTNRFNNSLFGGSWSTFNGATLAFNAGIAPDGTNTAVLLTCNTSYESHVNYIINGANNSISLFAKKGTKTNLDIVDNSSNFICSVNMDTWTVASQVNCTTSIIPYQNGWYRIVISNITNVANYVKVGTYHVPFQPGTVFIWGAQMEASTSVSSYIPTSGSTVTRAAEVATLSNANSSVFPTSAFTTVNTPFGTAGGGSTVKLVGPTIKRTAIYAGDLPQVQINALTGTGDFWRWRVVGQDFALPSFTTNGSVTVDWGDGVVETLTTAVHTFANGGGYHDIGFRLNSGTFFKPNINNNATYKDRVISVGPAPASMKIAAENAFNNCTNLRAFDATVDASGSTSLNTAWDLCSSLASFPLINTANVTSMSSAWRNCSLLTSFPLINTSNVTAVNSAWSGCVGLKSFPLIDTSKAIDFSNAWFGCSGLTSFPLLNSSKVTNFTQAWDGCSGLLSFPALDTNKGTTFAQAWRSCAFTSFPLINTSSATTFQFAWNGCSNLTTFPANMFDATGTLVSTAFLNTFNNCALTAASIENILTSFVTNGQSNITLNLAGGTNAGASTWTANAVTAYNTLISRGWTITRNA